MEKSNGYFFESEESQSRYDNLWEENTKLLIAFVTMTLVPMILAAALTFVLLT